MKRFLLFIIPLLTILSCMQKQEQEPIDYDQEKKDVLSVIEAYHHAAEDESFMKIEETLADEVIFFGTDSSEVIKSRNDFKTTMQEQWKSYQVNYGPVVDQIIEMDNKAKIATVLYGISMEVFINDTTSFKLFTRNAKVLKKENKQWKISHGVVGLAGFDEQYIEFIKKPADTVETNSTN